MFAFFTDLIRQETFTLDQLVEFTFLVIMEFRDKRRKKVVLIFHSFSIMNRFVGPYAAGIQVVLSLFALSFTVATLGSSLRMKLFANRFAYNLHQSLTFDKLT